MGKKMKTRKHEKKKYTNNRQFLRSKNSCKKEKKNPFETEDSKLR